MSERLPKAAQTWAEEAGEAKPAKVWVTPTGQRMIRVPQLPPPRYFAVVVQEDGSEAVMDWPCLVRCHSGLPGQLGLDTDHQTLLRLIKGDFISAVQITPKSFLLDLTSLHQFLHAATDPLYWTPARKTRFQESRAKGEYV